MSIRTFILEKLWAERNKIWRKTEAEAFKMRNFVFALIQTCYAERNMQK